MTPLIRIDHPWIDEAKAPLYQLTFPPETSDQELLKMCSARERWAERAHYPVAWVVDLGSIMKATARQRSLFSEHLARFEHHDVSFNQGSALIVPNAFVRGIVTAVFWMKSPRFPNECFATRDAAIIWAIERLRAAGVSAR